MKRVDFNILSPTHSLAAGSYLPADPSEQSSSPYNLGGYEHYASPAYELVSTDKGRNVLSFVRVSTDQPSGYGFSNSACVGTDGTSHAGTCQQRPYGGYVSCGFPENNFKFLGSPYSTADIDLALETGITIEIGGKVTWHYYVYGRQSKTDLMNRELDMCEVPAQCPLVTYHYEPPTCFNDIKGEPHNSPLSPPQLPGIENNSGEFSRISLES